MTLDALQPEPLIAQPKSTEMYKPIMTLKEIMDAEQPGGHAVRSSELVRSLYEDYRNLDEQVRLMGLKIEQDERDYRGLKGERNNAWSAYLRTQRRETSNEKITNRTPNT